MSSIDDAGRRLEPLDEAAAREARRLLDQKTKPRGSLGRLEEIVCHLAAMRGTPRPRLRHRAIVVMGADHGVAEEGVSAYPPEVTGQMLLNFVRGGAAINVLARLAGARVVVVDMGLRTSLGDVAGVLSRRMGQGTRNFTREPAMDRGQAERAVACGIDIARSLASEGHDLVGLGDMGIGNTTASAALVAAYTGARPADVTGRGTGVDDAGLARKVDAVRRGLELHRNAAADDLDVLARLGGFEIAGLAGVAIGAASERIPVLLDGFISGAAALAAVRLVPGVAGYLIASHRSVERGHAVALEALGLEPVLDLGLRLGEGTGAALAMGIVEAGLRVLHEMATFGDAGVTDGNVSAPRHSGV